MGDGRWGWDDQIGREGRQRGGKEPALLTQTLVAPRYRRSTSGSSSTEQNYNTQKSAICKERTPSSRKSKGQEVDQGTAQDWPKPNTLRKPTRGDSREASVHHLEG